MVHYAIALVLQVVYLEENVIGVLVDLVFVLIVYLLSTEVNVMTVYTATLEVSARISARLHV